MKKWAVLACFWVFPVHSAEPVKSVPASCFTLQSGEHIPFPILLDACTGVSWGLIQSSPDSDGTFQFRWFRIDTSPSGMVITNAESRAQAQAARTNAANARAQASTERARQEQVEATRAASAAFERDRLSKLLKREPTEAEIFDCVISSPNCRR